MRSVACRFKRVKSKAGSRNAHSYSKPCDSYSRTKSRHSRCYSHYRRKARPKGKPPLSSLEIIPCSRSPHSYLTREGVTLLNLPKDIFNFLRIGKELPRVLIRVFFIELNLNQEAYGSELRFNVVQEVDNPKRKVN